MKLQAKFTLNFILLVVVTLVVSFVVINWSVQSQFNQFIHEKNQQWGEMMHGNPSIEILINPFDQKPGALHNRQTPEDRFLDTVSHSLFLAGMIVILLAIVLAYFLSKFFLQRIYRLQSSMHQYMQDGTSKPVLQNGNDEVDELAHMYNLLIEKIEKEEKIRREFFIDMSHELRTPLTSIKGYLEGLVDKVFDPEKEKDIHEKTLNETDRMIHLVKEMTTLAKLESEELKLSKELTDLKKLTEGVIDILTPEAEKKHVTIEIDGEAKAEVDPYKFKQVMINLLENALHYGKNSEPILIEMGEKEGRIFWSIRNTTEGLNEKELAYFFERFYRSDKSRNYDAKKPHLGIGLNIVKKIVEQHGGTISTDIDGEDIIFEILIDMPA